MPSNLRIHNYSMYRKKTADYLGEAVNKGTKGYIWNLGMLIAIFINALGTAGYFVFKLM